ncbi:uncharacterized protein BDR25DRAFT_397579 [Lindgomyces ingoldianus]|uniref:Uncharacterized protein n=1 Tax=Lindgomyces ingoldianus TaxID=673940 RepID=A0ACB6Q6M2_9PLEO|nr:uncharacterized protein BDR25DRAFT_397579 [Lindgomyces ingoldianus]KAF2462499.1 hypothetical protein BDR25DRAFT_397579 [Lindgomyces ingoldianus]
MFPFPAFYQAISGALLHSAALIGSSNFDSSPAEFQPWTKSHTSFGDQIELFKAVSFGSLCIFGTYLMLRQRAATLFATPYCRPDVYPTGSKWHCRERTSFQLGISFSSLATCRPKRKDCIKQLIIPPIRALWLQQIGRIRQQIRRHETGSNRMIKAVPLSLPLVINTPHPSYQLAQPLGCPRTKSPLVSSGSGQLSPTLTAQTPSRTSVAIGGRAPSILSLKDMAISSQKARSQVLQPTALSPPEEPSRICECCDTAEGCIWNCSYCDMNFCDLCWGRQGPHKPGRTGPDGLPHEKADPNIVKRLKNILTPPTDTFEQQSLHLDDEDTTWFGIARDNNNQSVFQDYGRYATIMIDSTTGAHKLRYPQLISFIGQTGAGKSTLVKMLIDQQVRKKPAHESSHFASPVVGSLRNENVPTSGDVHLYGDPNTYFGEYPLLYADCEGLEGGENLPVSAQYCNSSFLPKDKDKDKRYAQHEHHRKRHKITKVARGAPRSIKWANSPEKSKRQYAVTELYPRLLYTFSDVIVFVLRNPKVFESTVLSKLIGWASTSMEKSLNQPTLPHAVIALNATDMEVQQEEWDPEQATKMLLSTVAGAIDRDSDYRALADYWSGRGRHIRTMGGLLECYYSSITVVRIPVKGRYMKIDSQIKKLHKVLMDKSEEGTYGKRLDKGSRSKQGGMSVFAVHGYDIAFDEVNTEAKLYKEK